MAVTTDLHLKALIFDTPKLCSATVDILVDFANSS